jgi:hypothetical protein
LAISVGQASAAQHRHHARQPHHQAPFVNAYAYAPDYAYAPVRGTTVERGTTVDFGGCARVDRNQPDSDCNRQNANSSQ